jgi:hypothetical protein
LGVFRDPYIFLKVGSMDFELLLNQISNINKKYDEIYKFSGERFNIFNILNLSSDELSHSRIVASLLDTKGTHGKNNKFLELFLNCVEINDFSINDVITNTEKFIGYISDDYDNGGKIDISITNDKQEQIFIENKINAKDGKKQLLRYHNNNTKAYLLYLTLFGNEPSEYSIGKDMKDKYKKISYKEHILKWVELCKKESIDNPILRETLTQYIILIKQLTDQTRSKEMQKEILDIVIKNGENVSAAFDISQNFNEIKLQILENKFIPLMEKLGPKHDFIFNFGIDALFRAGQHGFCFEKEEWKKYNINISFEFQNANLRNLTYGLKGTDIPQDLNEYLKSLKDYKHDDFWPISYPMEKYTNWDKDFFYALYNNEDEISNLFEKKIEDISLIMKNYIHK